MARKDIIRGVGSGLSTLGTGALKIAERFEEREIQERKFNLLEEQNRIAEWVNETNIWKMEWDNWHKIEEREDRRKKSILENYNDFARLNELAFNQAERMMHMRAQLTHAETMQIEAKAQTVEARKQTELRIKELSPEQIKLRTEIEEGVKAIYRDTLQAKLTADKLSMLTAEARANILTTVLPQALGVMDSPEDFYATMKAIKKIMPSIDTMIRGEKSPPRPKIKVVPKEEEEVTPPRDIFGRTETPAGRDIGRVGSKIKETISEGISRIPNEPKSRGRALFRARDIAAEESATVPTPAEEVQIITRLTSSLNLDVILADPNAVIRMPDGTFRQVTADIKRKLQKQTHTRP